MLGTVLIVDDEKNNIQVLGTLLRDAGYSVLASTNGAGALRTAKEKLPDLILLDIMMPEMDGYEVAEDLKNNHKTEPIPIIFVSAKTELEDKLKGFDIGAIDYITKPYEKDEVLVRVESHITLKKFTEQIVELNTDLKSKNEDLEKANAQLKFLNEYVSNQNQKIRESINYASQIIHALLPNEQRIQEILKEHFMIFRPKDMVGGDFFWMKQKGDFIYTAIADSTGHGVPGAFLSLLGSAYLNEILLYEENISTGKMIFELGKIFRSSFDNIEVSKKNFDLELALCRISLSEKTMQYSGTNMPIYLLRENRLEVLSTNKNSLQYNIENQIQIEEHTIELETEDLIYITTDGIAEQLGGESKMKFLKRRFEEFLLMNHKKSFSDQQKLLINYIEDWRSEHEQTDDICCIGFRIPESYGDLDLF